MTVPQQMHPLTRRSFCAASAASLAGCATQPPPDAAALRVGRLVADDFLRRAEIMMYRVDDVEAVHYAEAATAYGAAKFAGRAGDPALVARVAARHRRILAERIPNTANHVDANVYGVWPLELFQQTGDPADRAHGLTLADGQWEELRPDGLTTQTRFWIDDVWMIGALQTQAFRVTRNPAHIDRAGREAAAYVARLQQPNGLFHHGPDAPFFWGRGNGWVAAGLAEVLSELPATHPAHAPTLAGFRGMMAALLAHQADDGMWRQLIDIPAAWPETSSTAMFAFAMALGARQGLLQDRAYSAAAARAWTALVARLGADGRLPDVCVGTGQSRDMQYYLDRPRTTGDLHGQAPMLWLAAERLAI